MSNIARLVNDGKRVLGRDSVFLGLYGLYDSFFEIIEHGSYTKEEELLTILDRWASNTPTYESNDGIVSINVRIFRTHQKYVQKGKRHREFGDIAFATIFSEPKTRVGFVNAFQIKVAQSCFDDYHNLFTSSNKNQLDFYRTTFIEALDPIYNKLICDFLHYFLISEKSQAHSIMEIPLSLTWLDDTSGAYWNLLPFLFSDRFITGRNSISGFDTMIRKQFLTTGIEISGLLEFCMPSLREVLEGILSYGVGGTIGAKSINTAPNNEYFDEKDGEFIAPDLPLSASIVIATEVSFLDKGGHARKD